MTMNAAHKCPTVCAAHSLVQTLVPAPILPRQHAPESVQDPHGRTDPEMLLYGVSQRKSQSWLPADEEGMGYLSWHSRAGEHVWQESALWAGHIPSSTVCIIVG